MIPAIITRPILWLAKGNNSYVFAAVMVSLVGLLIGLTWPDAFPWSRI